MSCLPTASSASFKLATSTQDSSALEVSLRNLLSPSASTSSLPVLEQSDTRVILVEEREFEEYERCQISADASEVVEEHIDKLASSAALTKDTCQSSAPMPCPPQLLDVGIAVASTSTQNVFSTVASPRECARSMSKGENTRSVISHRRTISVGELQRMQSATLTSIRHQQQTSAHPMSWIPQRTYTAEQVGVIHQQRHQQHSYSFNQYMFMASQQRRHTSSTLSTQMMELEGWWKEVNRNIPFERLPTDSCISGRKVMPL